MFERVTLIGNVGQDPSMRYTPDGTPVTQFSLATKETISKRLPNGGERPCPTGWKESYNGKNWEVTTWFSITVWRGLAETVNSYVRKGSQLFVEGRLKGDAHDGRIDPRIWTGSEDGKAHCQFELVADVVKFLGKADNGNGHSNSVVDLSGFEVGEAPPES